MIVYILGMIFYIKMRKDDKFFIFVGYEKISVIVILVFCLLCIIEIMIG